MSAMKNGSVRCDTCGRLTRDITGQYERKDGGIGTIAAETHFYPELPSSERDLCDECFEGMEKVQGNPHKVV